MTRKSISTTAAALAAITASALLPAATAFAQGGWRNHHNYRQEADNRQKTKNDWRNLAIAAGGVGVLGLLQHDPTISLLGAAGGLYSLNRYEQDRKSQSNSDRARAEIYSHPYVYKDGDRYDRRVVNRDGRRYYQFVRH
jgi:hypothetical protein